MHSVIYVAFDDRDLAEKAVGALLDHEAEVEDICLLFQDQIKGHLDLVQKAESGVTTTTWGDAAAGARLGGGIGAAIGALAALGFLAIPGFGLVFGGGALATALVTAAGTAVGGAISGGVAGFLQDQGFDGAAATNVEAALRHGGALLSIHYPSGKLDCSQIETLLTKYRPSHMRSVGRAPSAPPAQVSHA